LTAFTKLNTRMNRFSLPIDPKDQFQLRGVRHGLNDVVIHIHHIGTRFVFF
jgi:hypothetical protein